MDRKDQERETGGQQLQPAPAGQPRMMHPPAVLPALLASGKSYRTIAGLLGCHRDTIGGWAKRPDIVAQVAAIRMQEVEQARAKWRGLEPLARRTIKGLLEGQGEEPNQIAQVKAAELVTRAAGVLEDRARVEVSGAVEVGFGPDFDPQAAEAQVLTLAVELLRGRGHPDLADRVAEVLAQGAEVLAEEAVEVEPTP